MVMELAMEKFMLTVVMATLSAYVASENIITLMVGEGSGEFEYTHIGNSNGGSSGIDSSTTNYDPSTGVVEFNVSGSGVLTVDSDTLYVDNGNSSDGYYDQTMGVYLDMGLGLSSALIPSSNTYSPEASIIVDSTQTTVNTLDGTVDVNAMPWIIELTDYDDVFIGRDAVYDSATNSYDPGNEVIIAKLYGNDMIDGDKRNTADFFQIGTGYGIDFNMNSGSVNIDEGVLIIRTGMDSR